jgi:hypothetical protein
MHTSRGIATSTLVAFYHDGHPTEKLFALIELDKKE